MTDNDFEHYYNATIQLSKENQELKGKIAQLEKELQDYRGWANSVNEALNSGDGTYRP